VLGCGKHFPGLGEANLDSHADLPAIEKPWKRLWKEDLRPYRELRDDLPFVMVAHAAYPQVTGDRTPASLSKRWMSDILRKRIGYRGLIITDDLDMGGVLAAASIEEAAVETLRAGADMFLVCQREESVRRAFEAVLQRAESDRKFARLIADRSQRVLEAKKKSKATKDRMPSGPSQKTVERLTLRIWEFSKQLHNHSKNRGEVKG
jgi:beta-N-acetylhexosaminidase